MRVAAFIVVEVAILAAAHVFGGPAWAAVAAVACVAHVVVGLHPASLVAALPAIGWLAASRLTGNSMLLATSTLLAAPATQPSAGIAAATGVALAFLATRVAQQATGRVLAVEFAATGVVLAATIAAQTVLPSVTSRWWLPAAASLAAYVCLAL
jgi:hypothetical protein